MPMYIHVHAYYCHYGSALLACYGDTIGYSDLPVNSNHSNFRDIAPSCQSDISPSAFAKTSSTFAKYRVTTRNYSE